MNTEDYRLLWKKAIHLCEIETNKDEAIEFVDRFSNFSLFDSMDNRTLVLTFVGLVVYEQKYHLRLGSTTPASHCYMRLLDKAHSGQLDSVFVYDVGDWAAEYSDNDYVPMDNHWGFGPRKYYAYIAEREARIEAEQQIHQERKQKRLEEGKKKVIYAREKHIERLRTLEQMKQQPIQECIRIITESDNSVFYYYELIESWLINDCLDENQKDLILKLIPQESTKHNKRLYKRILDLANPILLTP